MLSDRYELPRPDTSTKITGETSAEEAIRIGVIGLGQVAEAHLAAYAEVEGIEVVAGAESSQHRRDEMSAMHGFRMFSDYSAMLAQEVLDLVCVLAPVSLHCEITEACAAAGVHVFCEKPIATSLFDAQRMVASCEAHGVKFFYGASYRFLPAIQKAREVIASGAIGDVVLMTESVLGGRGLEDYRAMGFTHYPEGGPGGSGMGLVDHGVHLIDCFPWLVDSPIVSVYGRGNVSGATPATEYVVMNFANGGVAHLLYNDASYDNDMPTEGIFSRGAAWNIGGYEPANAWHAHPGHIRVYGTSGALRIFYYANQLFLTDCDGQRQIQVPDRCPPAQFAMEMESFSRSIREDTAVEVTGRAGIEALRVVLSVYESNETGGAVKIPTE